MPEHQGKKLKDFLESYKKPGHRRKSMEEIALELQVSRTTLYNYFDKEEVDPRFLKRLMEKGYPFEVDNLYNDVKPTFNPHNGNNIVYVPLFAYGGFLHGYSNKVFMDTLERFSLPGIHGEHFAFEVQGTSMSPYANPGDVVISRKEEKLEWMIRGRAYVLQTIDGLIFKIFDRVEGGKACFKSADKTGSTPSLPLKDIKGAYQVVKVLKDFMPPI